MTWEYRAFPGLTILSLFLTAVTVWILVYLGEILALSQATMVWFARVEYLGIVAVGPLWLAFSLAYTGRSYMITGVRMVLVGTLSLTTLVLQWTTSGHGLMWRSVSVRSTAAGSVLAPHYGPWFWVNTGFQYGFLILATLLLLWGLIRESSTLRGTGLALLLGTLAPWIGNLAYLSGWSGADGIDLTVYGLAGAGVAFGWGLLARTLVEIVPVARERVVETSNDAVLVLDKGGWIVDANPAAVRLLEGPIPLLRSQGGPALAHHGLVPQALPSGRSLLELRVGTPPRSRIFDCQVSHLGQPGGGREQGRVLAVRDVTEAEMNRRALEEGREVLEAQLRQAQKMETVGTLAGGIAHDFNNILASIRGFAELALADLPSGSESEEDLSQVIQATDRARNLVRQILTFSRQGPESKRLVNLRDVIREAVGFLRASLPSSVALKTELGSGREEVFADDTQIYQVVINLCSNAADALEGVEGGLIEVGLDKVIPPSGRLPEELTPEVGKPWARIRVRDNGRGMDEMTRRRVFDPFFTTKEVGKGTGLGLAVVHGIVARHGGWVDFATRPGEGTEVTVFLPPVEPGQAPILVQTLADAAQGPPMRVLVVDDEEGIRGLCERFLEAMGHEVRIADDAPAARRLFSQDPDWPDLVLTDQTMPGGTGLGFVEHLRAQGFSKPVLMMTGFGDDLPKTDLDAAGITLLLSKPFSRLELTSALNSLSRMVAPPPQSPGLG